MPLYAKVPGPVKLVTVGDGPTINNGIATDFTSANYLKTNQVFSPGSSPFEIVVRASCTNNTVRQNVLSYTSGNSAIQLGVIHSSGVQKVYLYLYSSDGTTICSNRASERTIELDKFYYYRLTFNGTSYDVDLSEDKVTWNSYITVNSSKQIRQLSTLTFGWSGGSAAEYLRGSLDLNESYIKIGDSMWYGIGLSRVKVKSGLEKYTKVGNPTISNGILVNPNSSNYIKINNSINDYTELEFSGSFTTGTNLSAEEWVFSAYKTGYGLLYGLQASNSSKGVYVYYPESSTYRAYTRVKLNGQYFQIEDNTTYYYRIKYSTSKVEISFGKDKSNLDTNQNNPNCAKSSFDTVYIGTLGGGNKLTGSIDLNNSYIKINGSYFWRGSDYYQNLDHYKVHQDNFSKYYTIVDGKLTWANPNIYLESTGTQYIDTGIKPTSSMKMQVSMSSDKESSVGSRVAAYNSAFVIYNRTSNAWFAVGNYTNQPYQINIDTTKKHIYTLSSPKTSCYIDNELKSSTLTSFNGNNYNIWLFGMNNGGSVVASIYRTGKIFNFKLWETNLIQHLVPVPKGLLIGNFVIPSNGMFDIVTQTFYGNAGTGEFEIGGIPDDYIIEGGKMIWCNPEIGLENNSNWSAYINTGIIPTNDMRFRVIAQLTDVTNTYDGCLFGSRTNSSESGKQFEVWNFRTNNQIGSFVYGTGWNGNYPGTAGEKYTFEYDGTTYTVNGIMPSTGVWIGDKNINSTLPIFLYGLNQNGSLESRRFRGKVFDFILWSGSTILQYLVPVPKGILIGDKIASSNCMFDLVTQTFFENQGTGEFTISGISGDYIFVGDNVVWCNDSTYLKCNGAQYFDSGFSANQDTKVVIDYTAVGSGTQALYCSRTNTSLDTFTMFRPITTSSTRFDYNKGQRTISDAPVANTRYKIIADKNKCYIDGVLKYTATESIFQSSYSMIFGCSNYLNSHYDNWAYHKYHNIQLYNNDHLIRYFIPVTTNMQISGTTIPAPGMWDMVTKKFFPNKGTGSFTYGKDS